jgi:hypothetical protein
MNSAHTNSGGQSGNQSRGNHVDAEKALKKEKGFMVFGLKSYIKALEMANGHRKSAGEYRYTVDADAVYARIVLACDGSVVAGTERTRQQWAAIGKPARLASIALRATKDELESLTSERIEYTFNVVTGEAYLTAKGVRLSGDIDKPYGSTIADWAKVGQPIEQSLFQQLTAAREWGNKSAEEVTRNKMIKFGVIRKPKADEVA